MNRSNRPVVPRNGSEGGFALLSVLLFLLVVSAIITPMVVAARTDFLLSSRANLNARQSVHSESIFNVMAWKIAARQEISMDELNLNSEVLQSVCGDQRVTVTVQDQGSLVDLNAAPPNMLEAGFAALGFSGGDAQSLQELVTIYRLPEDGGGSSGDQRLQAGFKHAAFEAVEELYEFPGFSGMAINELTRVFTLYSRKQTINSENMSSLLRQEIPLEPSSAHPYVIPGEQPLIFAEIRVTVENPTISARGFKGAIVEFFPDTSGTFQIVQGVSDHSALSEPVPFDANIDCNELLGSDIAQWIND